jgi:hypothetical protein
VRSILPLEERGASGGIGVGSTGTEEDIEMLTKREKALLEEEVLNCVDRISLLVDKGFYPNRINPPSRDPLDGDETQWLATKFLATLDIYFGNITREEYEDRVKEDQ